MCTIKNCNMIFKKPRIHVAKHELQPILTCCTRNSATALNLLFWWSQLATETIPLYTIFDFLGQSRAPKKNHWKISMNQVQFCHVWSKFAKLRSHFAHLKMLHAHGKMRRSKLATHALPLCISQGREKHFLNTTQFLKGPCLW